MIEFPASYPGTCPECGEQYKVGYSVAYHVSHPIRRKPLHPKCWRSFDRRLKKAASLRIAADLVAEVCSMKQIGYVTAKDLRDMAEEVSPL